MIFRQIAAYLILTCVCVDSTNFTVVPSNLAINVLADYVWTIDFLPVALRSTITLTFSNNVTLTATSAVVYNSLPLPITANTTNSVTFTTTSLATASSATITVTNVRNPPMAITSNYNFTLSSAYQTSLQLANYNSISYTNAQLSSCSWQFSLCTQQPNSQLTITIVTQSPMYSGFNQIIIGYAAVWANHNSKNLMFQVTTFTCAISLDAVTYITSSVTCSNNVVSNKITLNFQLNATLPTASNIYVQLIGVQTPPTSTTLTSTSYLVATADSNGYLIDQFTGCTINPVCITNVTNGAITTSPLTVNQVLTSAQIDFISYPIITVLTSDVVSITYSPQSNLVSCTVLKYWRSIASMKILTVLNPANYSFIFPSDVFQIVDTSSPIYLYISCTAFIMPTSQAPASITFHFYRANSQYLQLTANIVVSPGAFNISTAELNLTSTQMANKNTDYLFIFGSSQPLSSTSVLKIGFPSDIDISGATCTLTINNSPTTITCSTASNTLSATISTSSGIAAGSQFELTLSNVTNPPLPQLYTFNFSSYYSSSDATSMVESASPAFNATYTTITTLLPTLTPSAFSVYTTYQANLTITIPIPIPAGSNFTITFPSQITQLTCASQPLLVNGTQNVINSLAISQSANTITFIKNAATVTNSTFVIMTTFRSPSALGTYNYVDLVINNSIIYIQSLNQLTLNVNIPSSMPVSIIANNPTTAQSSTYSITLTYTVPHPATFDLQIDLPTDTTYITAPGTCTPSCAVTNFNANGSQVVITITNPNPNSLTIFSATYTVSSFNNRRYVGIGTNINFTTISASNTITQQSAAVSITAPSLLTGELDPSAFYTRDNSAPVNLYLNLSVSLMAGDYFLLTMDRTTYNSSSALCSPFYGTCTVDALSTANVLIINLIPNISSYTTNPLHITLQNLMSGHSTNYLQTDYITATHLCSSGLIETGKITYQISCGSALALPNQCRTCYANGSCIDCYSSSGYYLNNNICVTSCGNATQYLRYANTTSSTCSPCTNNCLTCINATACMSCLNSSFYLFTDSLTCQLSCPVSNGYIVMALGSMPTCVACSDPFCVMCTAVAYGSCTQCNNISTLNNGICLSTCPSISYYVLNSQCVACDTSCYSCFAAGNTNCLRCASGYANSSGVCSNSCPAGTAYIANLGVCGCDASCLACSSTNYINCTSCVNSSYFIYLGQCVASCPAGAYRSSSNCLLCPTGCASCSGATCSACLTSWYLFSSACYSDCNQISQQYDTSGSSCQLCPTGCDTCSTSTCDSCVQGYTLSGSTCVQSCSLTSSCQVDSSSVVPLPGCITLVVWAVVLGMLRAAHNKNYTPYSLLTLSSVVQLIQLSICILLLSQVTSARLLLATSQSTTVLRLLLTSLVINYIFNLAYIFVFLKYVKPLVVKPKQTDIVSHCIVIVIATLTNYRFGLLAYSRMCSKPAVRIDNSSRLTPIHYLCIGSALLDILLVIACGLCLYTQQKWTPLFMLSMDLLIIVVFNTLVTIWFVASSKSDQYYDDKTKYETDDEHATHENMSKNEECGEKDDSKINMIAIEDIDEQQYAQRLREIQNIPLGNQQYKSIRVAKAKASALRQQNRDKKQTLEQANQLKMSQIQNEHLEQSYSSGKIKQDKVIEVTGIEDTIQHQNNQPAKDLFAKELEDVDYEEIVPHKKLREVYGNSKITSMRATPKPSQRYPQPRNSTSNSNQGFRFDKELEDSYQIRKAEKNVFQPTLQQESDFPELQQVSVKRKKTESSEATGKANILNNHQSQYIRPIRKVKQDKQRQKNNMSSILPRGVGKDKPKAAQTTSVSGHKDSEQYLDGKQQQLKEDDFESIIRQKVFESSIRKKYEVNLFEEEGELEDISPSKYNAANQRFRTGKP